MWSMKTVFLQKFENIQDLIYPTSIDQFRLSQIF